MALRRNTLLTLTRSSGMLDTPTAVLIKVGHKQHRATVNAEVKNDLEKKLDEKIEFLLRKLDRGLEKDCDWKDLTVYTGTTGMNPVYSQ